MIALHKARLSDREGGDRSERSSSSGFFDVLALLIILFVSYPWLPEISWLRAAAIFGVVVVTVLLDLLVFIVVRYDERAVHGPLCAAAADQARGRRGAPGGGGHQRDARSRGAAQPASSRVRGIRADGGVVGRCSAISYWILMEAFHLDLPLDAAILVTVAINLSLVLPSSARGARRLRGGDDHRAAARSTCRTPRRSPTPSSCTCSTSSRSSSSAPSLLGPAALRRNR